MAKKKDNKKEEKIVKVKENSNDKKKEAKKEKKSLRERFMLFCHGVKNEAKKVHWTGKSDMIKYSIATIIFVLFCSGFFYLIDIIFALVQSIFK